MVSSQIEHPQRQQNKQCSRSFHHLPVGAHNSPPPPQPPQPPPYIIMISTTIPNFTTQLTFFFLSLIPLFCITRIIRRKKRHWSLKSNMASEIDSSEISALFERLVRNRDMSMFLPFIFGFSDSSQSRENNEDQEEGESESGTTDAPSHERIILVNPFTQGMVVIDGASSLEALFREIGNNNKIGQPPASKESIESMACVEVQEGEESGACVVCLEDYDVGVVVKEMPCKHRFHPNCIEKWLGIHGSCPVCRYVMPFEERDEGKKRGEEGEGERRTRVRGGAGGEVWVSFSINRNRRSHEQEQNQAPSGGDGDSSDDTSSPIGDAEV